VVTVAPVKKSVKNKHSITSDKAALRRAKTAEAKLNRIKMRKKLKSERKQIERERRMYANAVLSAANDLQNYLAVYGEDKL